MTDDEFIDIRVKSLPKLLQLSHNSLVVLLYLIANCIPHDNKLMSSITQQAIAQNINKGRREGMIDQPAISKAISRLIKSGYIRRIDDKLEVGVVVNGKRTYYYEHV